MCTFSGAGPPFSTLYLMPKSSVGPPGLWLADRMKAPNDFCHLHSHINRPEPGLYPSASSRYVERWDGGEVWCTYTGPFSRMSAEVAGVESRPSLAMLMRTTPLATAIFVMIWQHRDRDHTTRAQVFRFGIMYSWL